MYGVGKFIEKCLLSIIAQDYSDFELIIVDDCSPDNSMAIAKHVLSSNGFVNFKIVTHKKNAGLSGARNSGLAVAQGKAVIFVDSDDYIESTMLSIMAKAMMKYDADIVVCNWREVRIGENEIAHNSKFEGSIDSDIAVQALLNFQESAYIWRNLFRKELFHDINFPVGVNYEDAITLPYLWKKTKSIFFVKEQLYNYVIRSGSISTGLTSLDSIWKVPDYFFELRQRSFLLDNSKDFNNAMRFFVYSWMRNLTLTAFTGNFSYSEIKPYLNHYRTYISIKDVISIDMRQHFKLIAFLLLLKANPYLYWRKFRK